MRHLPHVPHRVPRSLPYWGSEARADPGQRAGSIKAIDPASGAEVWSWRTTHPVLGSVLATGGGLIFTGLATGEFVALDARTGRPLWQFRPAAASTAARSPTVDLPSFGGHRG